MNNFITIQNNNIKINQQHLKKYMDSGFFYCEKHPIFDIYLFNSIEWKKKEIVWDQNNRIFKGIVLDNTGNILCRPFQKFFTVRKLVSDSSFLLSNGELFSYADTGFRAFEKIEGHLCYLFWYQNEPIITSQKSFTNDISIKAKEILKSKYINSITQLDKNNTYAFELVTPELRLLIDYGDIEDLFLIGVINNKSGQLIKDFKNNIFPEPKKLKKLSINSIFKLNQKNKEGLIIRFDNGEMVKYKFKWYYEVMNLLNQSLIYTDKIKLINKKLIKSISNNVIDKKLEDKIMYNSNYCKEVTLSKELSKILNQ